MRRGCVANPMQANPMQATAAMTAMHERTVIAALTFTTFTFTFDVLGALVIVAAESFNSGCSSVAKCTALATLDSMDVKL